MNTSFQLTTQAIEDLDDIWQFIATENEDAAEQLEREIIAACRRLAAYPLMGHKRRDITTFPVRFWTLPKYPNYSLFTDRRRNPCKWLLFYTENGT
jgi:antitoxin ParD1/3/4/toxin ParE1/3/4